MEIFNLKCKTEENFPRKPQFKFNRLHGKLEKIEGTKVTYFSFYRSSQLMFVDLFSFCFSCCKNNIQKVIQSFNKGVLEQREKNANFIWGIFLLDNFFFLSKFDPIKFPQYFISNRYPGWELLNINFKKVWI